MKPATQVAYTVHGWYKRSFVHRKRLVGGFYSYDRATTPSKSPICRGSSAATAGRLRIQTAEGRKAAARRRTDPGSTCRGRRRPPRHAVTSVWLGNNEEMWFEQDNDRIDLLPEKKRYEPGDTARFQVRTPFKEATALVTRRARGRARRVRDAASRAATRCSTCRSRATTRRTCSCRRCSCAGASASVRRPRWSTSRKPAFKMGLAEIKVGWAAHELAVKVDAGRARCYKVRDKAKVAIAVRRPDGSAPPKGSEVALAAVDEGLLELLPNDSWKLLDAMMARRGDEVETATAQMQVIGKRHFGRKAVRAGGGGGRAPARELFDTLLLWKARVPLDDAGNATVEVPLNDSLTSFRIVAVASPGAGLFGTGAGVDPHHAGPDAAVRPAAAGARRRPLPRRFTVRNARPGAPLDRPPTARARPPRARRLPALDAQDRHARAGRGARDGLGRRRRPLAAPPRLAGRRRPRASAAQARDAIKVAQKVVAAVPERTYQATILQLTAAQTVPVERPGRRDPRPRRRRRPDAGEARGDLPGVRVLRALSVTPASSSAPRSRSASRPDALERADGGAARSPRPRRPRPHCTPVRATATTRSPPTCCRSPPRRGFAIPDAPRARMEQALVAFVEGRVVRSRPCAPPTSRSARSRRWRRSRAQDRVTPAVARQHRVEPNLWPTVGGHRLVSLLKRQPGCRATTSASGGRADPALAPLFQGTTMGFSTERDRRALVADGVGRLEREQAAARA